MSLLPDSVRVAVRGWLNCNQVLLRSSGGHVLVDSGYQACADETLARLRAPEMLGAEALASLVNTHCHSDHIGGNAAIARAYGCPITIPRDEVPTIDDWSIQERWNAYVDQYAEPFAYQSTIAAGEAFRAADREWQAWAAPGHDMEALMFFDPGERILISGDALWENGLGFVWAHEPPNPFVEAALSALDTIERLAPRVVIPGHGEPFADVAAALARARSRLGAFADDPRRTARHMMKVMFVFSMLHRGGIALAEADAYALRVPCYRDLDERFLGEGMDGLGTRLVEDLVRAGAMRIEDGWARPTMAR
ncbi:MAG TPA: MBL fold metallo-hydrolase [Usitatibacteraceae bacterium]|nr:MBL fold metallo-hydrolase [Usitatibacteraceae bacterium]